MFGGALGDDFSAFFTGFGADVDEVVGLCHDGGVVLYDDDGVAFVNEAVEDVDEFVHVLLVQADTGFLDEVEVVFLSGSLAHGFTPLGEFTDELDALGFAAGEGGGGLSELEVTKAGVVEQLEGAVESGVGGEKFRCLADAHPEDLADILAVVAHVQCREIIAHFMACFTGDPGGGKEIHFQFDASVAFALGALSLGVIEGET